MQKMRFALAGYGAWGRFHARALRSLPETELVAVYCHGDAAAQAAAADLPGVAVHRDYHAMLAEAPADAVDIVVPNRFHADFACAALASGRHVFLEKPLATTIADCDRVIAAERASGRIVALNHELRASHQWGAIRREIDAGAIGRPRYANFTLFRHPFRLGAAGWRHDPARVGSWILEEPVHFFDLLMWYFADLGDPVAVRAEGNGARAAEGMYDNFTATLRYADGAFIAVSQSLGGFEHHCALDIVGERGAVHTWWSASGARSTEPSFELKIHRGEARVEAVPETVAVPRSGEVVELEEMISAAARGFRDGRVPVSSTDARKSIVACLTAEEAVRQGRELKLEF